MKGANMDYKELIERLATDREWAEANEWESPICLQDDLSAAISSIEKLKAYEGTGLEPEKVVFLKDIVEDAFSEKPDFTNHLRDLLQAEKDGRLVVLPCKVGDTVYFTLLGRIIEKPIFSIVSFSGSTRIYCAGTSEYFRPEDFGKTVFLTHEEAKAALGEKGGTHETNPV